MVTILAEPAVYVLTHEIEDVTQQSATHSISQGYNNQINNQPVDGYAWSKQNTHGVISHICYAVFKSGNGKSAYQKYHHNNFTHVIFYPHSA